MTRTTRRESTLDTGEEDSDGRFLACPKYLGVFSLFVPLHLSFLEDETPRDRPGPNSQRERLSSLDSPRSPRSHRIGARFAR